MFLDMLFENTHAVKIMAEPKSYIRLSNEGEPQLVHVYPVISNNGVYDQLNVAVYLDENGPHVVPKDDLLSMLKASSCVLLEEMMHWKVQVH